MYGRYYRSCWWTPRHRPPKLPYPIVSVLPPPQSILSAANATTSSRKGAIGYNGPSELVDRIIEDIRSDAFRDRQVIAHSVEIPIHRVDIVCVGQPLWPSSLDEIAERNRVAVHLREVIDGQNHKKEFMQFRRLEMTGPRRGCDELRSEIRVCITVLSTRLHSKLTTYYS